MTVNSDNIMSVDSPPAQSDLIADFSNGEGMLQEKLHLQVDKSVPPVVLPLRKVPFALRESLKQELDGLGVTGTCRCSHRLGFISHDTQTRNGNIRLCIDPRPLNKALKRNQYPLPLLDDLLAKLTNAKVFSVVNAKNGFWHLQLDEEGSLLTTLGTPWGRYRWTRMPFGISPAPE